MFNRVALIVVGLLGIFGLLLGQGLLVLACALFLAAAALAGLWNRYALARVGYERQYNTRRAHVGDQVELTVRIANRKLLPLVSLWVRDELPPGLEHAHLRERPDPEELRRIGRATALRWYERVTWHIPLTCTARGALRVGPATLLAGDPFGIYSTSAQFPPDDTLIIYPQLLPLSQLGLPARHPLGELRARALFSDPMRTIGARDYQPGDPLKDLHWSATARMGKLQTRVYEPGTSQELAIFLDLDTFEHYYEGVDLRMVERLISAAASIADQAVRQGDAVGLYVNGGPVEGERLVQLPPGRNPTQLTQIMETLARLSSYSVTRIARLIDLIAPELPPGTTLLLISAAASEATRAALAAQALRGRAVGWVFLGANVPAVPRVRVYRSLIESKASV